jgi:hypothetical protein
MRIKLSIRAFLYSSADFLFRLLLRTASPRRESTNDGLQAVYRQPACQAIPVPQNAAGRSQVSTIHEVTQWLVCGLMCRISKTPNAFVASRILQVLRGLTAGSQVTIYGRPMSGVGIIKLGGTESFWFVVIGCAGAAPGRCLCPPARERP